MELAGSLDEGKNVCMRMRRDLSSRSHQGICDYTKAIVVRWTAPASTSSERLNVRWPSPIPCVGSCESCNISAENKLELDDGGQEEKTRRRARKLDASRRGHGNVIHS